MDISDRKRVILSAVISLHTDSGDPVGSNILNHFLAELSVSSATLRNEMAELTSLGLLMQPHTSAGRVPTRSGMRYYVENLMHLYPLAQKEKQLIEQMVRDMDPDPDKAAEASAKALSEMFDVAAMAVTPRGQNPHIVHFEMMRTGRYNLAVIGVTNSGSVTSRICRVEEDLTDAEMEAAESILNEHLVFVSSEDVSPRLIAETSALFGDMAEKTAPILLTSVALVKQAADVRVYTDGEHHLLHYREMEHQMMAMLELLSDTGRLAEILLSGDARVSVMLGDEIDERLDDTGLVLGKYHAYGLLGGLAVAGPMRLNYAYIIPRLHWFCDCLTNALKQ